MSTDKAVQPPPFDLRPFAEMGCEAINIGAAADGDPARLAMFQQSLRDDENAGWCRILMMDDNFAVVKAIDHGNQQLITINFEHPAVAAAMAMMERAQ